MGSKTRKSENSSSPPPDVLKLYQDFLQRAMGNSNLPFQSSIAPFNQDEQSAFGKFSSIPGHYLPQAEAYARQGASPINQQQISRYENPYQQDVINATMGNINETNAQQQNQVVGNAISQGALGGNRVKVAQSELARQQGLANNSTLAGLNASNYQQALQAAQGDRSAAQQGAGQFMGLQDSALQGALAQLNSGRFQQQQASAKLGEKNSFPYQQTNWLGQILGSIGPLEGGTSTQTQPGPSLFSQLLGLGTAGVGAFGGKGMTGGKGASAAPGGLWARGGAVEDHARSMLGLAGALRSHFAGEGMANPYEGGISIPPFTPAGISVPPYTPAGPDLFGSDYAGDFSPSRLDRNGLDVGALIKHYIATKGQPQSPDIIAGPPEAAPSAVEDGLAYGDTGTPSAGIAAANGEAQPTSGLAALAGPQKGAWRLPVIAAGLGMMASQSPFVGTAIGEGGLAGIQAYSEAKKAAAINALAQSELGLRGRGVDLEAERLQQQADQFAKNLALETKKLGEPKSTAGNLAWDLAHGNITQQAYDKATGVGALLSPDAIDMITDQVLAGDMTAMSGYARNPVMKAQIVNALATKANAQGMDGAAIAASAAAYGGDKAAQRSAGTRAAQVGMAASEANQMADIALDASKAVPRGDIVPWTKAVQSVQTGTSSPEMAAFVTATTSLVNAYARAVSPLGAPTDAMRQHAEAMLNVAQGPEAYEAVIKQMKKEMQAALNAPVEIRQRLIDRGIGKTVSGEGENANSAIPDEAAAYLRQHPELAVQFDEKYGPGSAEAALKAP